MTELEGGKDENRPTAAVSLCDRYRFDTVHNHVASNLRQAGVQRQTDVHSTAGYRYVDQLRFSVVCRLTADWRLIVLLLYSPLGIILLILRLVLSFQLFIIATILPKSLLLRRF
jgi:hypothetical protein